MERTIAEFIAEYHLSLDCEEVDSNPNLEGERFWEARHYRCTLKYNTQRMTIYYSMGIGLKNPPDLENVLDNLAAVARECDYIDFEDWADECGYDPDSRRAERIYNTCVKQSRMLESFLGEEAYHVLLWETESL